MSILQVKEYGYIPAALPDQNCYGDAFIAAGRPVAQAAGKAQTTAMESPVVRAAEKAEASIEEFMQKFYARVRIWRCSDRGLRMT